MRAYLAAAVHHKVRARGRKERRHAGSLPADHHPVDPTPPVDRRIEAQDLLAAIRDRLPEASRALFDWKAQGLSWSEVAERAGDNPDALRMRLRRAVAAVLSELDQGEPGHAD